MFLYQLVMIHDQLETMRVNLLAANSICALLQLLVPPVQVALHDHDYDAGIVSIQNDGVMTSDE